MIPQLTDILHHIPVNIDTAWAREKLKRLIRQLEEKQQPNEAIPYPRVVK